MIIERNHDVKIDEKTFSDAATVGRFVNRNYSGYLVPTNADIPELDVLFVGEFDKKASPLAAKGLGELTAVSVAPAIANAVYHTTGKKARDPLWKRCRDCGGQRPEIGFRQQSAAADSTRNGRYRRAP
jgi:hypothetical protein